jgi:hypothetical protein
MDNMTVQQVSAEESEEEPIFSLSEPELVDGTLGEWAYTILVDKDTYVASVSYASEEDAVKGRTAMAEALKDAVFISTCER